MSLIRNCKQQEGVSVGEYVTFIRRHFVCRWSKRDAKWSKKFGEFDPSCKESWFLNGLREDVGEEMQRILKCRKKSAEDLSLTKLADVAQDAEDVLMLKEKKSHRDDDGTSYGYSKKGGLSINKFGYPIVYIDGHCPGNGTENASAGIGVCFAKNHRENKSEPLPECMRNTPTNTNAEIWAMIRALEIAKRMGIRHLEVRCNSHYRLAHLMDRCIFKWLDNGWIGSNGKQIEDKLLLRQLLSLMRDMEVIKVVRTKRVMNRRAGILAKEGVKQYRPWLRLVT